MTTITESMTTDTETQHIENWRSITGYSNYEVSDFGNVRRTDKNKLLKPRISINGYPRVSLCKDGKVKDFYIHHLVANAFIGPCATNEVVDHCDRDRKNNKLSNIRYVTYSDNNKNKSSYKGIVYEYVDKLPEDFIPFNIYNGNDFENYWYSPSNDKFYFHNGVSFRILHINKNGKYDVFTAIDVDRIPRTVYVQKWKNDTGF